MDEGTEVVDLEMSTEEKITTVKDVKSKRIGHAEGSKIVYLDEPSSEFTYSIKPRNNDASIRASMPAAFDTPPTSREARETIVPTTNKIIADIANKTKEIPNIGKTGEDEKRPKPAKNSTISKTVPPLESQSPKIKRIEINEKMAIKILLTILAGVILSSLRNFIF